MFEVLPNATHEVFLETERHEFHKRSIANKWRWVFTTAVVGGLCASLLNACRPSEYSRLVPPSCDKPFPQVCLDLSRWEQSGMATLTWQTNPDVNEKNNIYHRYPPSKERQNIGGVGVHKLKIVRDSNVFLQIKEYRYPNLNYPSIDYPSQVQYDNDSYVIVGANPQQEHYISIEACSSVYDCETSEEVFLPKQ